MIAFLAEELPRFNPMIRARDETIFSAAGSWGSNCRLRLEDRLIRNICYFALEPGEQAAFGSPPKLQAALALFPISQLAPA